MFHDQAIDEIARVFDRCLRASADVEAAWRLFDSALVEDQPLRAFVYSNMRLTARVLVTCYFARELEEAKQEVAVLQEMYDAVRSENFDHDGIDVVWGIEALMQPPLSNGFSMHAAKGKH